MHVMIDYGDEAAEGQIIRLVRGENSVKVKRKRNNPFPSRWCSMPAPKSRRCACLGRHRALYGRSDLRHPFPERWRATEQSWIEIGASPRGGIGLDKCSRAHAWLAGRDYVSPDDVRAICAQCYGIVSNSAMRPMPKASQPIRR